MVSAELILNNPTLAVLFGILALDALLGDPNYALHPVRLMGRLISSTEHFLFKKGLNGLGGGALLILICILVFVIPFIIINSLLQQISSLGALLWQLYWGFHMLAVRDLCAHGNRIAKAASQNDIIACRHYTSYLVGRDTDKMETSDCCRAGIESLSENLTDSILAPLFWFLLLGIPGMILFKIISTLDSMVGYKSERYFYFGKIAARLDDLMNYLPARLSLILISLAAFLLPGQSAGKAFKNGLQMHSLLPGPNSGWSEAAASGALGLRLAGPIYNSGVLVNELWLGQNEDPSFCTATDIYRMIALILLTTLFMTLIISVLILAFHLPIL
jgi:adenosylcobinamide-phosphate synthase